MEAYKKTIIQLLSEKKNITVIDVGCARCALLNEFLINYFDRNNIKIIGIDPLQHDGKFNAFNYYDFYIKGCVDNIPRNSKQQTNFYINEIDQASSMLKIKTDNFTSDLNNLENKYYYPEEIINRLKNITNIINVDVYNINDIISNTIGDNIFIDFIKIDAEGKDLDIAKSLQENFHRIKYIAIECSSHKNKEIEIFENGSNLSNAINFFNENGFDIYDLTDYSIRDDNKTQMTDVVFINKNLC